MVRPYWTRRFLRERLFLTLFSWLASHPLSIQQRGIISSAFLLEHLLHLLEDSLRSWTSFLRLLHEFYLFLQREYPGFLPPLPVFSHIHGYLQDPTVVHWTPSLWKRATTEDPILHRHLQMLFEDAVSLFLDLMEREEQPESPLPPATSEVDFLRLLVIGLVESETFPELNTRLPQITWEIDLVHCWIALAQCLRFIPPRFPVLPQTLDELPDFPRKMIEILTSHSDRYEAWFREEVESRWNPRQITHTTRALLWMALAEAEFFSASIPLRALFHEYGDLAGLYGTEQSPDFLQGVLNGILVRHLPERLPSSSSPDPSPNT